MEMLGNKMEGFNDEGDSLDSEIYDLDNVFFEDIKEMRNNLSLHPSENLLDISEIFSKEGEKESQQSTRIRSSLAAKGMASGMVTSMMGKSFGSARSGGLKMEDIMQLNEPLSTENAPTARSMSENTGPMAQNFLAPQARPNTSAKIMPEGELLTVNRN
jgi:hypothetical protein